MVWFISLPMSSRTDEEIKSLMSEAKNEIFQWDSNATFVDTFIESAPDDAQGLWYLGESIKRMDDADAVYMCYGWEHARGCIIEHESAKRYKKFLMYQDCE